MFTHLGEENAREILRAVRERIAPDGLFIVTIRPIEFWHHQREGKGAEVVEQMLRLHTGNQYAFIPSGASKTAGSSDYGEASCSIAKFASVACETGWVVAGTEWLLLDPFQILISLKPQE